MDKKYIISTLIIALLMAGITYAAPSYRVERTILPEINSTYDLGSNTNRWNNIFANNATITNLTVAYVTSTQSTTTGSVYITNDLTVGGGTSLQKASSTFFYASGDITSAGSFTGNLIGNVTGNADTATNLADYSLPYTWSGINTFSSDLRALGGLHATTTDFDALQVNGNGLITGTLGVTGLATFANASTTETLTIHEICNEVGVCWNEPAQAGTFLNFYPNNNTSDITTYEDMLIAPTIGLSIDESCAADSDINGGYCDIDTYISTTTDQQLTSYPAGTTEISVYTYVSSAVGVSKLEFTGYYRDVGGTETRLGQATTTEINSLAISEVLATFVGGSNTAFNPDGTDRLVIKVRGYTTSNQPKTIHWTYQTSGAYSHIKTPITRQDLGYVKSFHDETITGEWTFSGGTNFGLTTSTNSTSTNLYISNDLTVGGYTTTTAGLFTMGDLHIGGNSTFDGTGHDSFSDFVANEHLDWTASVGTIHADNYTNTTYLGGTNLTLVGTTFNVDDAFLVNSADDTTAFGITMGSATTSDTFRAEGKATFGGNVGIGRAGPVTNLDIAATTNPQIVFSPTTSGQTDNGGIFFREVDAHPLPGTASSYGIYQRYDGILNALVFDTVVNNVSSNTLTITRTGNVGIGTTGPGAKLDVNSGSVANIAGFFSTHATTNEIFLGGSMANDDSLVFGFNPTSDYGYLQVWGDAAGSSLVIANGGNVGIGTTNPTSKLYVSGDIYTTGNMSALSITDRTPIYEGDALTEISKIKGKDGKIDHSTLPEFVKAYKPVYKDVLINNATTTIQVATTTERNIGNMISMNVVAIQQLIDKVETLEAEIETLKTVKMVGVGNDCLPCGENWFKEFINWIRSIF